MFFISIEEVENKVLRTFFGDGAERFSYVQSPRRCFQHLSN